MTDGRNPTTGLVESAIMRTARARLILVAPIGIVLGCTSADGERGGVVEWWRGRSGETGDSSPSSDARRDADRQSELAPARLADRGDRADPPSRRHRAPSRGAVRAGVLAVGDEIITVADVLDPIRPALERAARESSTSDYIKQRDGLVRRAVIDAVSELLIWQEARFLIDEQIEPQLQKAVDRLEKQDINRDFGGRETRYENYLASMGKTRQEVREGIRRKVVVNQYLRDKLVPMIAAATKPERRRYYDDHLHEFSTPAKRELHLIDIPIRVFLENIDLGDEQKEARARESALAAIDAAAAELAAGKPFDEVAKKHSHGVRKDAGGAWGFLSIEECSLQDRWRPVWERLGQMQPGECGRPFEASKAFFIVRVGRAEGGETVSFRDAQQTIADRLRDQRYAKRRAEFLQKRFDKTHIRNEDLDDFFRQVLTSAPTPGLASNRQP